MKESYILFVLERHEPKVTCWTITLPGLVLPGVSSTCWPKCRTIVETSRRRTIHCSHVSLSENCSFLAAGFRFTFIRQLVTSYLTKMFSTAKSLGPFHYTVVVHCISKSPCVKCVFNKQFFKVYYKFADMQKCIPWPIQLLSTNHQPSASSLYLKYPKLLCNMLLQTSN